MQANQVAGIDLPLKALVYEDASGKAWRAYEESSWIVQRRVLGAGVAPTVHTLTKALEAFAAHAVKSSDFQTVSYSSASAEVCAAPGCSR